MGSRSGAIHLLAACVAAALFITACSSNANVSSSNPDAGSPTPGAGSPDPKPGTPEAEVAGERMMRTMSDTLARSRSFSFETSEQIEVVAPGGEKRTLSFTRKVTVRRPNALFFELHGKGDTALDLAAYYDGRTLSLSEKPDGAWAETNVPGTLDEMVDDVARRFNLPVPIGDVVYSSPYDAFIGSSTRGGFVKRETIDGVECARLDYGDEFVEVRLWLPVSGPALPRRLELVYKKAATPHLSQVNFTSWTLDAPVSDATFAFQQPRGREPDEFGNFVAGLFSRIVPSAQPAASPAVSGAKPATSGRAG